MASWSIRAPNILSPVRQFYSPSSPRDVFEVRHILVKFLPTELANAIIDEAAYWPRVVCAKDRIPAVHASAYPNHDAAVHCLTAPAFPSVEELSEEKLRVKLVKFRIESHDQGWGGEPEHRGTYRGSHTWFEAAILRPGKPPELQGWRRLAVELPGLRRFRPSTPLVEVENPAEPGGRWRIQTNLCAVPYAQHHTVVWREGGPPRSGADGSPEEDGSGDGAGFIEALTPGARIGVVARAMYPMWSNHVQCVELVAYYAV
ncbi:hypothetical protein B0H15DRAFT_770194 [Mycena belliarum]|uniref:Uncharacterized protein n=1 Tax=Mycena belliarum TaxID=1033014 RepID=A0AAD6XSV8_9AGAR|nr:hypothetical protein B0H15DRAFT_770194 [Mycena belliae]